MALTVDNLSIRLQGKPILDQACLSIDVGEILAICGANGAGKSTLLKAMSKDIPIDSGRICINGVAIDQLSPLEMAHKRAMMPQQVDINFHFTTQEIIEMGLYLTATQQEKLRLIDEVADMLELRDLLSRSYLSLSGGQKQRVQLARVIGQVLQNGLTEPRFLFLDECTSAMDIAMVSQVFDVLNKLIKQKSSQLSVVAVVHDLNIASLYADKIAFVHDKHCAYVGKPAELLTESIVGEVFGTSVNIIAHPESSAPMVIPRILQ